MVEIQYNMIILLISFIFFKRTLGRESEDFILNHLMLDKSCDILRQIYHL